MSNKYSVGDPVLCHGKPAIVRFVGETHFGPSLWIGISFVDKPHGKHDGSVQGRRYFTCQSGYGLFVRENTLKPYDDKEKAAILIQSAARGQMARNKTRHETAFQVWNELESVDEDDNMRKNRDVAHVVDTELKMRYGDDSSNLQRLKSTKSVLMRGESVTEDVLRSEPVPASYKGPRINFPIKKEDCVDLLNHFRDHPEVVLHRKFAWTILSKMEELLEDTIPTPLVRFSIPKADPNKETRLLLCGDVHGQLNDVLWLFYKFGPPSPNNIYLFNGDLADRGKNATEIFLLLFAYKLLYPQSVIINRGNHESADMNEVYGFAYEVRQKYGGLFYRKFQDIFHLLPLAIVIEGRILCVHGGLFRKDGVTLRQIENLNRMRPCPEAPYSYEDYLMFDLLWSDPQADLGRRKSTRGVDCMTFGPDVTDRFLSRNNLEVCIRSHQVPSTGRGFEVHHEGKCVTVFSASNYCGTSGNYGGVIVFQPDLSFEIQEYWAPSLEEIQQLAKETQEVTQKVQAMKNKLKDMEKRASIKVLHHSQAAERMEQDSIKKIARHIVEKKQDLWWYFWNADETKKGRITPQLWREGCSAMLGDTLPWMFLQKQLKVVEEDGLVDYNAFLKRFRVEFSTKGAKHIRWKTETIQKVFEAILRADLSVRETLLLIDRNSDGTVSYSEFRDFVQALNLGLSDTQTRALMRTITASHTQKGDATGRIHVAQFLARFKVVYKSTSQKTAEPWLAKAVAGIGRLILTEAAEQKTGQLTKEQLEAAKRRSSSFRAIMLLQKFQTSDKSGDGYLSYKDFIETVKSLPLHEIRDVDAKLDDAALRKIAEYVDITGNGHINYCEFLNAFHVVDKNKQNAAANEVWEDICSTIMKHKNAIRRALKHFDSDLTGKVDPDDFRAALSTLNTVLARSESPLTETQIDELVDLMDTDDEGNVDYEEFLESFAVIDVVTPA